MATVLDASALLVVLHDEPGASVVELLLEDSRVSAVNWSEVVQKALARGIDIDNLRTEIEALGVRIEVFDAGAAENTAKMWAETKEIGLSLGDRACLALARSQGATAVTADKAWAKLDIGVSIQVVR
jgi:PIN domain nuclease of toxin-antitoxin system